MHRIRFLRIILPLALIGFVVLLVNALRTPPQIHRAPEQHEDSGGSRRGKGIRLLQLNKDRVVLDVDADMGVETGDGKIHLENIRRFVIDRLEEDPLIVSALAGDYEGVAGERIIRFDQEVVIRDPVDGLVLRLPALEVDESTGEARCTEELRIEGPGLSGRAATLVYGLHGQPTELTNAEMEDVGGLVVTAEEASLLDGLDEIELRGNVVGDRGAEESFRADRLRWWRWPNGEIKRIEADGLPASVVMLSAGVPHELRGETVEADWDDAGVAKDFHVEREAFVQRGIQSMSAARIDGRRSSGAEEKWLIDADGTVYLAVTMLGGPAWLRAEHLDAEFDGTFALKLARASEAVRFEGPATRAEADRATFQPSEGGGEIRLQAVERPKARLARENIRIAGERIVSDLQGSNLVAEGNVEATLLPEKSDDPSTGEHAMFRVDEAIHFVSEKLESENAGERLTFSGGVRGWQSERNLAAQTVIVGDSGGSLIATREVMTRIPRDSDQVSLSESDYVQIGADRLEYEAAARQAIYRDNVRVRLAEGWMEAERMEIDLAGDEGSISSVRAHGGVQIEFRDPEHEGTPRMISGTSDRLAYDPREETILLYGDNSPAAVRRIGGGGGTTSGRVLRYRLDLGTLEVDAGSQGPARIRTTGN